MQIAADISDTSNSCFNRFHLATTKTKRLIQIRLVYIRSLSNVDTVNQVFSAIFGIDMLWPATAEDQVNFTKDASSYVPSWVPNFEFPNAQSVDMEQRVLVSGSAFKITPNGFNFLRTLCTGTFMHQFDLASYPCDVQNLQVILDLSFDLKEEAIIVPWMEAFSVDGKVKKGDMNFVQLNRAFSSLTDFEAKRVMCEFAVRDDCWAQLVIVFQVERLPQGVFGRIGLLCLLLGVCALNVFAMQNTDIGDRVNFLITNILAFVAFAFVVQSQLPSTPRLTLLDLYSLSSVGFLVLLLCVIAVMSRVTWASDDDYFNADNNLFFASVAMFALIQILFVLESFRLRRLERGKFKSTFAQLRKTQHAPSPVNVYGDGFMVDSREETKGDPFVAFQGMDSTRGNIFGL